MRESEGDLTFDEDGHIVIPDSLEGSVEEYKAPTDPILKDLQLKKNHE